MPKTANKLTNLKSINKTSNFSGKESVQALASFANIKPFKKRDTEKMLPTMTCNEEWVAKFKAEAKTKKWKYTTLMNEILEERYGKINKESDSK